MDNKVDKFQAAEMIMNVITGAGAPEGIKVLSDQDADGSFTIQIGSSKFEIQVTKVS